jgi:hypothetical protein
MWMALNAALWTFFSFMFSFQLNNYFHSTLLFRIPWFIVGISIGIFFSALVTLRQLNTLEKKGEDPTTLKTIFIVIGAAIIAIVAISEIAFSNLPNVVESAMGYSIVACTPASFLTRTILMIYWEKQKRTRIFQDKYGLYISTNDTLNSNWGQNSSSQTFQANSKAE